MRRDAEQHIVWWRCTFCEQRFMTVVTGSDVQGWEPAPPQIPTCPSCGKNQVYWEKTNS